MTRLLYFAWVREKIGVPEEMIDLPHSVVTAGDLIGFLARRGDGYAEALAYPKVIRVAVNQEHVEHDEPIGNAQEIALFPPMTGG
jgi:sulfur-carrier protein